ncbi:MAG: DUF4342 domain-containing protein [Lachnospiraceae bacterium]|nr:DUF4342 domain-containing protein [Lachnospiraceae bacterium]
MIKIRKDVCNMDNFEKVEKIREKTGVSYQEAKEALEATGYDMLDAMVYLEKLGKVPAPDMNSFKTDGRIVNSSEFDKAQETYESACKKSTFGDVCAKFFNWFKKIVKKGCDTTFVVDRNDENVFKMPVIVLVCALIFLLPVTAILLIVGMFCDCRYSFIGFESTSVDINEMCSKASDACMDLKNDLTNKQED